MFSSCGAKSSHQGLRTHLERNFVEGARTGAYPLSETRKISICRRRKKERKKERLPFCEEQS
jgi:hypothetical protein